MFLEDILGARNVCIVPFLMNRGPHGMFPRGGQPADIQFGQDVNGVTSLNDVLQAVGLTEHG